jgi:hypothetical protein
MAAASSQHSPHATWSVVSAARLRAMCGASRSEALRPPARHVSRYDHAAKRLELLLTCPVCDTETVIHSLAYEPRFDPSLASVHALHPREGAAVDALDRAASAARPR